MTQSLKKAVKLADKTSIELGYDDDIDNIYLRFYSIYNNNKRKILADIRNINDFTACIAEHAKSVFKHLADLLNLPARRGAINYSINIIPRLKHLNAKIYGISKDEGLTVKAYIKDIRGRGEIRKSKLDFASPVLVVYKPRGRLRICVDYRALNAVTIKNRNAFLIIKETLAQLANVAYFTVVDVIAAFNKIRIKEGDKYKTAFLTQYSLFKYLAYINKVLHNYFNEFCSAYLDDVLVYSASLAEHKVHVRKVIKSLGEARLYLDIYKSEFAV
ncbi:hypothetical protein PtrM4_076660 [Pyrenophora tritici-repentis]|uniref:Reverse transcriptase domain-containing protein n=1 Tax=Pyrenophora tritici-repentis TaxID=45151 RepID=A0A834RZK8_9PLEO|nr:hypothetical protein PtrM4_076660 [Pyrenophora tritici-repentis]